MSDAELVIRLLGDSTPAEQLALNTSVSSNAGTEPGQRTSTTAADATAANRGESGTQQEEHRMANRGIAIAITELRDSIKSLDEKITPDLFDRPVSQFARQLEQTLNSLNQQESTGTKAETPSATREADASPGIGQQSGQSKSKTWMDRGRRAWGRMEAKSPMLRRASMQLGKLRSVGKRFATRARTVAQKIGRTKVGSAVRGLVTKAGIGMRAAPVVGGATSAAAGTATAGGAAAAGGTASAGTSLAVGATVGSVVVGFAAVAAAAIALAKTFSSAADTIEQFSPDVSLARERARMNTELNMLDRAQRIGPASGRLEAAKGSLSNQLEKLMTDLLVLVSKFEPQITAMVNMGEAGVILLRQMIARIELVLGTIDAAAALLTPQNAQDDAAAAARIAAADKEIRQLGIDFGTKLQEVLDGMMGQGQNNPNQIDPLLAGIMNANLRRVP